MYKVRKKKRIAKKFFKQGYQLWYVMDGGYMTCIESDQGTFKDEYSERQYYLF